MNEKKTKHVIIIFFGIIITLLFCVRMKDYLIAIFLEFSESCVNLVQAGLIGDFFGGFIGTIFAIISVYLLYSTLVSQRQESNENREVLILQQFDNVFFELLDLHKQNVDKFQVIDLSGDKHTGRDFFIFQRKEVKKYFIPKTAINRNRKEAIVIFEILYNNYYDAFSIYFRTLYQLYTLILSEPLTEKQKVKYAKILRAQLTNAELFFIRYNAMTEIGSNSVKFINEYNLLKHLSSIELLEFQFWNNKMNDYEIKGLETIFKDLKHILKNIIEDDITKLEKVYKQGKYNINVISKNNYEAYVSIVINNTRNPLGLFSANGLCKLNIDQIHNLLKSALKEFIIYSNYNKFNIANQLNFETLSKSNGVVLIKISNRNKNPLKLKRDYSKKKIDGKQKLINYIVNILKAIFKKK